MDWDILVRIMLIVGVVATVIIISYAIKKSREEDNIYNTPAHQPTHFNLPDDNGNTLPPEPVIRELQFFCIKDSGYYISVWPKNNRVGGNIEFDIAGLSYRDSIYNYIGEHVGILEAEPDNQYDANAIKILAEDGHHVGYVPKDMTLEVRKFTQLPCTCYFYIGDNDGIYFSNCYIRIN